MPMFIFRIKIPRNLIYEGPVDPKITGGFSNTFNYKAFSLNVFVTYQAGNKIQAYILRSERLYRF